MTRKDILPLVCRYNGITERAMQKIQNENPMRLEDMIKSFLCQELNIRTTDLINLYAKKADLQNLEDIVDVSLSLKKLSFGSLVNDPMINIYSKMEVMEIEHSLNKILTHYSNGKYLCVQAELKTNFSASAQEIRPSSITLYIFDSRCVSDLFYDIVAIDQQSVTLLKDNFALKTAEEIISECRGLLDVHDIKKQPIKKEITETFIAELKYGQFDAESEQNYYISVKPKGCLYDLECKLEQTKNSLLNQELFLDGMSASSDIPVEDILSLFEKYLPSEYQIYRNFVNRFKITNTYENDFAEDFKLTMFTRVCSSISPCIFETEFLDNASSLIKTKNISLREEVQKEWYLRACNSLKNSLEKIDDTLEFTMAANVLPNEEIEITNVFNIKTNNK